MKINPLLVIFVCVALGVIALYVALQLPNEFGQIQSGLQPGAPSIETSKPQWLPPVPRKHRKLLAQGPDTRARARRLPTYRAGLITCRVSIPPKVILEDAV